MHHTMTMTAEDAMTSGQSHARFRPGRIVATPASLAAMAEHNYLPLALLARHLAGDWGEMTADNARANEDALKCGNRVLSNYVIAPDVTIWLITEADRSSTTFLLPSEY